MVHSPPHSGGKLILTDKHTLEWRGLMIERGDRLLCSDLSYRLEPATALLIEGANGAGKTTLLRALCGLFMPSEGEILWGEENIRKLGEEYRRHLLYLGHLGGIKLELNALENLRFYCQLLGQPVDEERLWRALDRIGLKGFEDLPCKMLSQGQKRRVALARLLLSEEPLWVLDEPFVALDVAAVELLQEVIAGHVESGGMAIMTTHQTVPLTEGQIARLKLGVTC